MTPCYNARNEVSAMDSSVLIELKLHCLDLIDEEYSKSAVASWFGPGCKTLHKWLVRYRAEGLGAVTDRSRRPHTSSNRLAARPSVRQILRLRRQERLGPGGRS